MTLSELLESKKYPALKPKHYLEVYDKYLGDIRFRANISVLEIGIANGGSLRLWRDYFPFGRVTGIDIRPCRRKLGPRIETFVAPQGSVEDMVAVGAENGPFDLVIDDGAHLGEESLNTFIALFTYVKPGGLYVIEDWGTGYWVDWPDGAEIANGGNFVRDGNVFPSHQYGMVGFIKQLVDVCNTLDRTKGKECSQINSMEIFPGMVILRKR